MKGLQKILFDRLPTPLHLEGTPPPSQVSAALAITLPLGPVIPANPREVVGGALGLSPERFLQFSDSGPEVGGAKGETGRGEDGTQASSRET